MPELLDLDEIIASLRALAQELGPGTQQHVVVLVGGAVMALHGLRPATRDVDSARHLDGELLAAAARVARQRELPEGWLNARALPWRPQTLYEEVCAVVTEHPRLLVLAAPLREVFLMKLISLRARDTADLADLWPHAGFATPEDAVTVLYEQAYPGEDPDPYLAEFLRGLVAPSGNDESSS